MNMFVVHVRVARFCCLLAIILLRMNQIRAAMTAMLTKMRIPAMAAGDTPLPTADVPEADASCWLCCAVELVDADDVSTVLLFVDGLGLGLLLEVEVDVEMDDTMDDGELTDGMLEDSDCASGIDVVAVAAAVDAPMVVRN